MDRNTRSSSHLLPALLRETVVVALAVTATYFVMQATGPKKTIGTPPLPTPCAASSGSSVSAAGESKATSSTPAVSFGTAKYGGMFSYEYPAGWHVAELWQDASGRSYIVMDPSPINTAPRGGQLGKFMFTLQNGKQNPDEVFQKELANFNDENYTDITKEELYPQGYKVYHYRGKMKGPMMEGTSVENYYFTFHENPSDPVNQQIVSASLVSNTDPAVAALFRHVVLSFKDL